MGAHDGIIRLCARLGRTPMRALPKAGGDRLSLSQLLRREIALVRLGEFDAKRGTRVSWQLLRQPSERVHGLKGLKGRHSECRARLKPAEHLSRLELFLQAARPKRLTEHRLDPLAGVGLKPRVGRARHSQAGEAGGEWQYTLRSGTVDTQHSRLSSEPISPALVRIECAAIGGGRGRG
eukprot:scaffold172695_cov36-Tisochrysis_lutea.AAC.1